MYTIDTETNNLVAGELVQLLMADGLMDTVGDLESMVKAEMDKNPRFREEVIRHMVNRKRRAA